MSNTALETPLKKFETMRDELVQKHHGQFVVISGDQVLGFYKEIMEGYYAGKKRFGLGNFLLKRCISKEEEVELRFHSRVM